MEFELKTSNVYARNAKSTKRFVINQGGTRSSKTYSICQIIAVWLWSGNIRGQYLPKGVCDVVRKTLPALKASAKKDFDEILNNWGLKQLTGFKENKTDLIYTFQGREVCFFSTDDEQKLRGRKRDIFYCNEANELLFDEFRQINMRCNLFGFIDFNPSDPFTWIKEKLLDDVEFSNDIDLIKSTYLDNPFLPEILVKEIERIKATDPDFWTIYGIGDFTKIRGIVYDNWATVDAWPTYVEKLIYAMDLGYSNDPTTLIKIGFSFGKLYVQELICDTGIEVEALADLIKQVGVTNKDLIVCDHDPRVIDSLRKRGINVKNAIKHSGINYGIGIVRGFGTMRIVGNSPNILKEIKQYKYYLENETPTNKPIDKFNHCLDAIRYGCVQIKEVGAPQKEYRNKVI